MWLRENYRIFLYMVVGFFLGLGGVIFHNDELFRYLTYVFVVTQFVAPVMYFAIVFVQRSAIASGKRRRPNWPVRAFLFTWVLYMFAAISREAAGLSTEAPSGVAFNYVVVLGILLFVSMVFEDLRITFTTLAELIGRIARMIGGVAVCWVVILLSDYFGVAADAGWTRTVYSVGQIVVWFGFTVISWKIIRASAASEPGESLSDVVISVVVVLPIAFGLLTAIIYVYEPTLSGTTLAALIGQAALPFVAMALLLYLVYAHNNSSALVQQEEVRRLFFSSLIGVLLIGLLPFIATRIDWFKGFWGDGWAKTIISAVFGGIVGGFIKRLPARAASISLGAQQEEGYGDGL